VIVRIARIAANSFFIQVVIIDSVNIPIELQSYEQIEN
jgi:hypothetical protein